MSRTVTQLELRSLTVELDPTVVSPIRAECLAVGTGLTPRAALFDAVDRLRHGRGWTCSVLQSSSQFADLCRSMPPTMIDEVRQTVGAQYVAVFTVESVSSYEPLPFMMPQAVA